MAIVESGWFEGAFRAMNVRLERKQLKQVLTGGWELADIPEGAKKPYGRIMPLAVRNHRWTNAAKYVDLELDFEVYAVDFKSLDGVLCPAVTAALQHAALAAQPLTAGGTNSVNITMIRPGDIEYEKEEQIWVARMRFIIQANQSQNPAGN